MIRNPLPLMGIVTALSACTAHEAASSKAPAADPAPVASPGLAGNQARYGVVHFPVSCAPAVQAQFDLGVSQLHSFFYPETVKTFTRIAESDPGCAMAYWGLAFAQMPNPLVPPFDAAAMKRAREAVAKGKTLAKNQREKDWLEAVESLFMEGATDDQAARTRRYATAMGALAERYPDDVEAQVFHALALLQSADPHDRAFSNQFQAARILASLEAAHPRHPGIVHYEIHAYDYSPIASQGLAAADAYAAIAPAAPHAVHMPSHVYSMLGMWDRSIASNRATLLVAEAYAAKNFPAGTTHAAAPHSLDFLEYAYLQQGKDEEASAVVSDTAAIQKLNVTSLAQDTGLAAVPVRHALERAAWSEAATLQIRPTTFPYAEALGRFGRALGAARIGTPEMQVQARKEIERMEQLRATCLVRPDQAYWAEQIEILIDAASGWLAQAEGDGVRAERLLRAGADLEDSSEKHVALENRLFPVREQLGYLLLEQGRPDAALMEFQVSLRSTPNRLRGYYGAARAAERAGYTATAKDFQEKLRVLTADATGTRAEVAYARRSVSASR